MDDLKAMLSYRPNKKAREKRLVEKARTLYEYGKDGKNHTVPVTSYEKNLRKVYMYVTFGCPMRCPFCYANAGERKTFELSAEDFLKISRQAIDAGYEEILILGGEPLVYKEFDKLLEGFSKLEKRKTRLVLRTSLGFSLENDKLKKICQVFDKIVVSIDGDEENHDKNRGKGVYKKAINNILACQRIGDCEIGINAILEKEQFEGSPGKDIIRFCKEHDINNLSIQAPVPMGRAKCGAFEENVLYRWDKEKVNESFDVVPIVGCQIGHNLYIEPDGVVYPCYVWVRDEDILGDLKTETIQEILDKGRLLKLINTGVDTNEKCKSCEVRYFCGGLCQMFVPNRPDIDSGEFDCNVHKQMFLDRLSKYGVT